jgi:hypothetical protein
MLLLRSDVSQIGFAKSALRKKSRAEERPQTVGLRDESYRVVLLSCRSVVESSAICLLFPHFHQHLPSPFQSMTEFSPKCSPVRCSHGILVRLSARPRGRIGLAHP